MNQSSQGQSPTISSEVTSELMGSDSFRTIRFTLMQRQFVTVQAGLMASQSAFLQTKTVLNGNIFQALAAKFFGGETLFVNHFYNLTSRPGDLVVTQSTPGDIVELKINNQEYFLEAGSFIAKTGNVRIETVWAGFKSFIAGEGFFRQRYSGNGTIWFGSFGAVVEKEVVGDFIVDSGHLLGFPTHMNFDVKLGGSIWTSLTSKEGIVIRLSGRGKIWLQTRSVKGLSDWLNSRFWR